MRRIRRRRGVDSAIYEARTRDILVRVAPSYMPEESDPEAARFLFGYLIEIENHGRETVTLVSRHWKITDALNRLEEVRGPGVVNETPELRPMEAFRYNSFCSIRTPSGAMKGAYQMVTADGETFDVEIPEFSLHLPGAAKRVN
ncbi:MAG: Co2+/Mg2+ efflux protein ApaG [Caulobacterales bacterium 68-7]|nr:Co2+/Mg2+ efflux protein ApaG [Caulobacterales bacterium]OJU07978.1 MAG: Co2+/Mg2+ efflux protein ApaG [Caulobacterales bacterium 68-7]